MNPLSRNPGSATEHVKNKSKIGMNVRGVCAHRVPSIYTVFKYLILTEYDYFKNAEKVQNLI